MRDVPRILSLPMTAAYFRLVLRRFGTDAARRAALLVGTGQRDDPAAEAEISVRCQLRQLANLDRLVRPGWGLDLGAALDVAAHGPAGQVAATAASLGAALDTLERYVSVRTPFVDLRVTRAAARCELRVVEPCHLGTVRLPVLEMVLLSLQATIESAVGRPMHEGAFAMPGARPAYWRRYQALFHAPVTFGGGAAVVSLPADWLALPCPLADPIAHRSMCARLESIRQRLAGDYVDARVEHFLASGGDTAPSLREVAAALRLSPRTLVRRLSERRTTFRALLAHHRRARGIELLAQQNLTVADIAARLGYDEPTNFARACRRWFGLSPRAYRAALARAARTSLRDERDPPRRLRSRARRRARPPGQRRVGSGQRP